MTATMLTTIESVNGLLAGTTIAPIALPQPRKSAPTMRDGSREATMATLLPTNGQRKRINAEYDRLNRRNGVMSGSRYLRPYATMTEFRSVFPTMLDASREYYAVKP